MDTISNFLCVEKMGWSDAYQGFMKPEDLQRLIVCNTVADAIELLKPIVNMPDTMNVNKI